MDSPAPGARPAPIAPCETPEDPEARLHGRAITPDEAAPEIVPKLRALGCLEPGPRG